MIDSWPGLPGHGASLGEFLKLLLRCYCHSRRCFPASLESVPVTTEVFESFVTRGRRSSRLGLTAPSQESFRSTSTKSVSKLLSRSWAEKPTASQLKPYTCTPPTPTRLNSTVASRRRRRCVFGIRLYTACVQPQFLVGYFKQLSIFFVLYAF